MVYCQHFTRGREEGFNILSEAFFWAIASDNIQSIAKLSLWFDKFNYLYSILVYHVLVLKIWVQRNTYLASDDLLATYSSS